MSNQDNNIPVGFKITGNWNDQAITLKEKFNQLTDADLKYEPGKEHELLTRMETRLNKKRDEVVNIVNKGQSIKA